MSAPSFLDTLRVEVARMQAAKPEKLGEIARANALIMQGQVVPCAEDPQTALVLSSDGKTQYHVNSHCDCQAGQHGKACKHRQSWLLYQHILKKMEAQTTPEDIAFESKTVPLPEARASLNFRAMVGNFDVQITLRDDTEAAILDRLQVLLKNPTLRPVPKPAPKSGSWSKRTQGR